MAARVSLFYPSRYAFESTRLLPVMTGDVPIDQLQRALQWLRERLCRQEPEDPYAYAGARLKPRPHSGAGAAALDEPGHPGKRGRR